MKVMYDSIDAFAIPADAQLVAGYLDSPIAWTHDEWQRFANATRVGIATRALTPGADVYDVETYDLTPAECPAVWRRERAQRREPVAYVNRGNRDAVIAAFAAAGLRPPRCWLATLDGTQPWDPALVAIQYAGSDRSGGHYDCSVVIDDWPDDPLKGETMLILLAPDGFQYLLSGSLLVHIPDVADSAALQNAGVKLVSVDQALIDGLKAAAAEQGATVQGSASIAGTLTITG